MHKHTILITGSSGFIGTNLIMHLLKQDCAVIALDIQAPRHSHPGYRHTDHPDSKESDYDLMEIRGDVRDSLILQKIFRHPIDYVIHLAALSTLQLGAEDYSRTMSVNAGGTEALLRAAADYGKLKGFLYASTDKVYGILHGQAYRETDPLSPIDSPYDSSKARADQMVREWFVKYDVPSIVFRFCNIYGPYDLQTTRIIPGTIRAILEGKNCILRKYRDSNGNIHNFQRDFLYIDDLCQTLWHVIEQLDLQGPQFPAWGDAFNLGAHRCYAMDEIIQSIQTLLGDSRPAKITFSESLAEIPAQRMDYSKAANIFGFVPKTTLEDGLGKTAAWWQQRLKNPAGQRNQNMEEIL
ncbi:MAG: GDP-mannose 4,6-dehydratase [Eubacterium sp.]|nr:GDP-mannose 4,6-dehydratase [Eubacterium sp.]